MPGDDASVELKDLSLQGPQLAAESRKTRTGGPLREPAIGCIGDDFQQSLDTPASDRGDSSSCNPAVCRYLYGTLPQLTEAPVSIVEIVARKLGGRSVLGGFVRSQADLALAVRKRLPLTALQGLSKAGLSDQEIEQFVIPQRTRRHRAEKKQPLTIEESDRAVRLLRVQTLAEDTFGDVAKANVWLRRPLAELHGEPPLAVAQTEAGARVVETILGKIAWGAAA
ncbi:antitoxin Xre/MbcA/ParS toxin-binding domain-containing protein [Bradyrhizobium cenepequi]|uniref:antitoxin Xre/MbcA/ParS toxin-binding domain-containing protein n=1 Tax=Bradyrhizobium cenepequi TaxID=2821403 RepID=UPI001CE238C0|nr:antitoxin Xre/MbcA/ParS toxin-binding domain-containing protein [Bradyrhizobium cenepequi]